MSKELSKKAVEMLLKGATLISEPCPYCNGVRVMKDGSAFCASCGKQDTKRDMTSQKTQHVDTKPQEKASISGLAAQDKQRGDPSKDVKNAGFGDYNGDSSKFDLKSKPDQREKHKTVRVSEEKLDSSSNRNVDDVSLGFLKATLDNKILSLSKDLSSETDYRTQQRILRTLGMLVDLLQKVRSPQKEE